MGRSWPHFLFHFVRFQITIQLYLKSVDVLLVIRTQDQSMVGACVFLKKWPFPADFFIFVFSIQLTVNVQNKFLAMTGFEPHAYGIGSNHSTN